MRTFLSAFLSSALLATAASAESARPEGGTVTVRDINIVPEPGLRNPKAGGNVIYREEASYTRKIGETFRSDYQLSYDWTLVPGQWVFQLWVDDRKMAEQIFTLVKE